MQSYWSPKADQWRQQADSYRQEHLQEHMENYLHWSQRKAFLSLLALLWNFAFRWVYISFSLLPLASLFSAICKGSSDNHFDFLHFFFSGMVLITASCTMLQTSIHSSSGTLHIRSNPLNHFSLPLYNHKGFDLGHTWKV